MASSNFKPKTNPSNFKEELNEELHIDPQSLPHVE
jgi:hypothetical protein